MFTAQIPYLKKSLDCNITFFKNAILGLVI